ncbi:unnamed protein product, partial [marine sediment metagenome]
MNLFLHNDSDNLASLIAFWNPFIIAFLLRSFKTQKPQPPLIKA